MTDQNAEQPVLTEVRDGVLLVTLNRPEARNAVNGGRGRGRRRGARRLDADEALRVGVLTGAGKGFSAGMDLKAFVAGESPGVEGRGFAGICSAPPAKPLIAAVEGFAVAGGLEIALSCDLIVAGRERPARDPRGQARAGRRRRRADPAAARIPYHVAMELALTGDSIDAERARARSGLVNRVARHGGAVEAALELAAAIAEQRAAGGARLEADRRRSSGDCPKRRPGPSRTRSSAQGFARTTPARAPSPSPRSAIRSGREVAWSAGEERRDDRRRLPRRGPARPARAADPDPGAVPAPPP